jgi:hypothetical protein
MLAAVSLKPKEEHSTAERELTAIGNSDRIFWE